MQNVEIPALAVRAQRADERNFKMALTGLFAALSEDQYRCRKFSSISRFDPPFIARNREFV